MKQVFFTVTNDLTYDQRMHRICTSLAENGYGVMLVGRSLPASLPLTTQAYQQKRLSCFFKKGFLFYAEYNLRLFLFLLTQKMDALCAIDLDTILPVLLASGLKGIPRVYDAHEFFTEMKEVRTRPRVQKFWTWIERKALPKFRKGYTVSEGLAEAFYQLYAVHYEVIRNLPVLRPNPVADRENSLLFQGAVNEARGFEYLVPAMRYIPYPLIVCGDGNFMDQLKALIHQNGVQDKVILKGMLLPRQLREVAATASLGLGFAEKEGINQFYALPNKFLEYMHAELPQIAMDFPEYQKINRQYKLAVLVDSLSVEGIATVINQTMANQRLLQEMRENAAKAKLVFCWQEEEKHLLQFYKNLLF